MPNRRTTSGDLGEASYTIVAFALSVTFLVPSVLDSPGLASQYNILTHVTVNTLVNGMAFILVLRTFRLVYNTVDFRKAIEHGRIREPPRILHIALAWVAMYAIVMASIIYSRAYAEAASLGIPLTVTLA